MTIFFFTCKLLNNNLYHNNSTINLGFPSSKIIPTTQYISSSVLCHFAIRLQPITYNPKNPPYKTNLDFLGSYGGGGVGGSLQKKYLFYYSAVPHTAIQQDASSDIVYQCLLSSKYYCIFSVIRQSFFLPKQFLKSRSIL